MSNAVVQETRLGFGMTTEVKCPVCGKLREPAMLRRISNLLCGRDDILRGRALVTKCCGAIVFKDYDFDYIRQLFNTDKPPKTVNGIVVTDKPELYKKLKVQPMRPEPEYHEVVV
jgi:hypothetical protein